jgi:dipeptide/tripeptide permease
MPKAHHLFTATGWTLNAAMLVSLFLTGVLVLAFSVCALAAVGLIHLPIPVQDLKDLKNIPLRLIFVAGAVACASGVFLLALVTLVLLMTARIVKTAQTDPFVEDNARRLMQIGWLLLAIEAVGFTAGMIISLFPKEVSDHVQAGFDLSPVGILAALLIFVLAQIFRRGAQMRAELEGTV